MNTFLLHCYFEWNVHFTYAYNLGVLDFLVWALVDWQSHSSFSTTNSAVSVALDSNLNRSIHFSDLVINVRSILSVKLRYISFLKDEAQRTKQIGIRYGLRGIQSFRTHGRFVPTFGRFVPNPLVDSYPRNYDTKCFMKNINIYFTYPSNRKKANF